MAARSLDARSALLVALAIGCAPSATPSDAAPPVRDAGFDPSALAPCPLDPTLGFDGAPFAAYAWPDAEPLEARAFLPLALLDAAAGDLGAITTARREGARTAAACAGDAACVRAAIAWSELEADAAAGAAIARLDAAALASALRASGVCARFDDGDGAALAIACVRDALLQATAALDAHVLGELDAAALDAVADAIAAEVDTAPFWMPAEQLAIRGLLAARRDEAIRYEPLALGENAAAIARVATIDFAAFPYAAIVVPGQGPSDPDVVLHPGGRARADLAADRWAAGLAPFVLVSGGHVHPDRTRYSEAIEMKRYLVDERGMPEGAIFVDPYARHTTTNLRNATRVLVRAGVPADRPLLVTSDLFQSAYIRSTGFADRCRDELGYLPFAAIAEVSREDSCFLPVATSLHVDARDPLDP